jgi:crotonobetainyl-CoA:carnitine CoA-transferase CaiB-like acyl-CoA transferase
MGAFALATALFQRERTGKGQRIDLAMLDVAMILMSSHLTAHLRTGAVPRPAGNTNPHATNSCYETKDGLVMLGASNLRQQRRLWQALERPEMAKSDNEAREEDRDREAAALTDILKTRTADEWETFFQARHVPAARVRTLDEALLDPHFAARRVTHRHDGAPGVEGAFSVPLAAFKLAHGGASIETPPPGLGADTDRVLAEHGYAAAEIAAFRRDGVI